MVATELGGVVHGGSVLERLESESKWGKEWEGSGVRFGGCQGVVGR